MNGFLHACERGHIEIVKYFLEKNVQIEMPNQYNGWRALHLAVGNGYDTVGKLLIAHGADKESRTKKGMCPIHCAAVADQTKAVRMLLSHGVDLSSKDNKGQTALEMAMENDCNDTVELFKRWNNYNKIYNMVRHQQLDAFKEAFIVERVLVQEAGTHLTVLDVAVNCKAFECLDFIFGQDIAENDVLTGLDYTLKKLRMPVDQFKSQYRLFRSILLERKEDFMENATVWNVNRQWILTSEMFLQIASKHNRPFFVRTILQQLVDMDESWDRAHQLATSSGYTKVADAISSRKAYITNRTKASYNRLHIAVQDNNVEVIKYILDNGLIDPNKAEAVLGTPLCLAFSLGHMDSVLILRQYGVDINKTNKYNQTPLHIAIESKMMQNDLNFLNAPANIDHKDCYGFTPLHLAVINNDEHLCGQLIGMGANICMPLQILKTSYMENLFMLAMTPLLATENPLSLCLKLHRTILPSLLTKINAQICTTPTEDGDTLLHLSSKLFIPALTEALINKGSNVNLVNQKGNTPLHSAFIESMDNSWEMEGFRETVQFLVSGGADINLLNHNGVSPFHCALNTNSKKILNDVLNQCLRVDLTNEDVLTLYQRQWADCLKAVLDLQDHNFKRSLLIRYITDSQLELIEFIMEIAGDEFVKSIVDELLCIAGALKKEEIFDSLLKCYRPHEDQQNATGAEVPQWLQNGETVLTSLISSTEEIYSMKLCEVALNSNGDCILDRKNMRSQTALHVAASRGFVELFEWLMVNCHQTEEEYEGMTAVELLVNTMGNTNNTKTVTSLEKIIKIMIKQGLDIYKIRNNTTTFISKITNPALKSRLENFYDKAGPKKVIPEENIDEDKYLCEICITNPINCQFGCGHPFCNECGARVQVCPKCRKPVTKRIPLYL